MNALLRQEIIVSLNGHLQEINLPFITLDEQRIHRHGKGANEPEICTLPSPFARVNFIPEPENQIVYFSFTPFRANFSLIK